MFLLCKAKLRHSYGFCSHAHVDLLNVHVFFVVAWGGKWEINYVTGAGHVSHSFLHFNWVNRRTLPRRNGKKKKSVKQEGVSQSVRWGESGEAYRKLFCEVQIEWGGALLAMLPSFLPSSGQGTSKGSSILYYVIIPLSYHWHNLPVTWIPSTSSPSSSNFGCL